MICFNCGSEIQDKSIMCSCCGVQIYNNPLAKQFEMQQQNQMLQNNTIQQQEPIDIQQLYGQQQGFGQNVYDQQNEYIQGNNYVQNNIPKNNQTVSNSGFTINKLLKNKYFYVVALVVLVVIFAMSGKDDKSKSKISVKGSKVNFEKYIELEYKGYDGFGNYIYSFDEDAFCDDYKDVIKFKDEPNNSGAVYSFVDEVITFEYYSFDNLSNGDEVYLDVIFDEELIEKYNVEWNNTKVLGEVEGLKEPEVVNPFEKYEIYLFKSYDGTVEVLTKDIYDEDDEFCDNHFVCEGDVENGNKVTIKARNYWVYNKNVDGKLIKPESLEYKVNGYFKAPTDISEINESVIDNINKKGQEKIQERIADGHYSELTGIDHKKDILVSHALATNYNDKCEYCIYIKNDSLGNTVYIKYWFENLKVNSVTGDIYYDDMKFFKMYEDEFNAESTSLYTGSCTLEKFDN